MRFIPAIEPTQEPTAQRWSLAFVGGQLLLPDPEGSTLAPHTDPGWWHAAEVRHYLGRMDDLDCWALRLAAAPEGWRAVPLRSAMMGFPDPLAGLAGRAAQVLEWDRTHRFCGACATPTIRDASERARRCPSCHHTAYPRISPAMMCLITRGREILLARNVNFPAGRYSALAGFLEAGESIEDAIHREVEEEVGLKVTNLRYFASQSWPFPHSLMIAFTAEFAGGELRPNGHEIAEADWFRHDALPQLPPRISIARALIDDTVRKMAEC